METIKPETLEHLKTLRLPANYGEALGVRKLLTTVPVGKPRKPEFFRTHASESMNFPTMILEQKESRESYLVDHQIAQEISELVRPVMLHTAIDRRNNVFLIPVPLPNETGTRNPWHDSLAQAIDLAKQQWIRIAANLHTGSYETFVAQSSLPEPQWPSHTLNELIEVAFRGKIITSLEHPVIQALLGKV